jgi:hypothetical protein
MPPTYQFALEPLRGAAFLQLGTPRSDLDAHGLRLTPSGDALDGAIQLAFDADDRLAYVELRPSAELTVHYRGLDVFAATAAEVAAAIADREPPEPPLHLAGATLYPGQIIWLHQTATHHELDGAAHPPRIAAIGLGSPGDFAARVGRPWAPPPILLGVPRFAHPELGTGELLSRAGSGPTATLELRFDDGTVHRLPAANVIPA